MGIRLGGIVLGSTGPSTHMSRREREIGYIINQTTTDRWMVRGDLRAAGPAVAKGMRATLTAAGGAGAGAPGAAPSIAVEVAEAAAGAAAPMGMRGATMGGSLYAPTDRRLEETSEEGGGLATGRGGAGTISKGSIPVGEVELGTVEAVGFTPGPEAPMPMGRGMGIKGEAPAVAAVPG